MSMVAVKNQWKTNDDWAWFVGGNREPIRLTTKPEPYTLQKALHWLQRQVAPTIKMVQALDRENHTTILKDMIEQAELKDKKNKFFTEICNKTATCVQIWCEKRKSNYF